MDFPHKYLQMIFQTPLQICSYILQAIGQFGRCLKNAEARISGFFRYMRIR